ncbi:MAG: bifunctional phosphopantothenoylcysteine decarboxylase/phosphopantothenate--cysteine ligase CoaBC [Bacteroidota bacterium]
MLQGTKILVGVTGSIAAYKTAYLIRLLVQAGAEVRVVMTKGALEFVTPLTFSTLSKNPVHSDFTENPDAGTWTNHVDLALWADLMVFAPLSASTLAKMSNGLSDNFLMAVYMSAKCPVMVAPAMDREMYLHPGTQANLARLREFGHRMVEPGDGELASGLSGKGRMAEPEEIFKAVVAEIHPDMPLRGKRVLVTAGPTHEKIDAVRFIGNYSSGKMGFAIAEALATLGADVDLISGPVNLSVRNPMIRRRNVVSAREMAEACEQLWPACHAAVLCAAVADFRPAVEAEGKIKKDKGFDRIDLVENPDIARNLGSNKRTGQVLVGFALETNDEEQNAQKKLDKKNLDMIVLNSLRDEGAGFGGDTNKITLIWPDNKRRSIGLRPKTEIAAEIAAELVILMK